MIGRVAVAEHREVEHKTKNNVVHTRRGFKTLQCGQAKEPRQPEVKIKEESLTDGRCIAHGTAG